MSRQARLHFLRNLVQKTSIETQEEIVERMHLAGFQATQATVSRDIKALGIIKIPLSDNRYVYGLQDQTNKEPQKQMSYVLSCSIAGKMIHIDVVPGTSAIVKRHLKEQCGKSLFSIIADDDSVLAILHSQEDLVDIKVALKEL